MHLSDRPPALSGLLPRVAVVMPTHNEEGLPGFLLELEEHLRDRTSSLHFVIVDDASTLPVRDLLRDAGVGTATTVLTNPRNLGHGPTALRAYRAGLATGADVVVHVDGDGQFHGRDFPRLLDALEGADVVHGERRVRDDPWFRRLISGTLRVALSPLLGSSRDVNTPLRAFRADVLGALLPYVDPRSTVPHVHLSLLVRRIGFRVACIDVRSRARRGDSATGTMWGPARTAWLPSRRLIRFCSRAAREVAGGYVGSLAMSTADVTVAPEPAPEPRAA